MVSKRLKHKDSLGITLFLLPSVILVLVFFIFPLIFLIYTSFTNWTGGSFSNLEYVGINNYKMLMGSEGFQESVLNTFIWAGSSIFILVPLALIAAMLLVKRPPGWKFLRTVYFFPYVVAPISLAYTWYFLYNNSFGAVNGLLQAIGLEALQRNWLGDPATALPSLIATWIFNIGYFMIIFMAQIGTISRELYEAAEIDGASEIQKERHITLPLLKGTIGICFLLSVTLTFKTFEVPFIMTNGGPGTSSQILPIMIYKNFMDSRAGISNAVAVVMICLGIITVFLVKRAFRNKERI